MSEWYSDFEKAFYNGTIPSIDDCHVKDEIEGAALIKRIAKKYPYGTTVGSQEIIYNDNNGYVRIRIPTPWDGRQPEIFIYFNPEDNGLCASEKELYAMLEKIYSQKG